MIRRLAPFLVALLVVLGPAGAVVGAQPKASSSGSGDLDTSSAIVVLRADPLATYDGKIVGYEKTRPDRGKLNPNSAAAKKYLGYLKQEHDAFAAWLRKNVPSAKITSEYFTVLNGVAVSLNGAAIGKLRQNADVLTVEYNALYRPLMSESYKLIEASGAWTAAGGRANAGAGVKVGVIDTGIDPDHPFFDPTGFSYPAGFPKCDAADSNAHRPDTNCKYVSPKVIVAKVFYNKARVQGLDAKAVQEHGTHVAGTIAGVTGKTAVVEGVTIDDLSGIAPGAWLGNYNVFPGNVASARSEDILNAVEAAVVDGMDVLNLSLGGGYRGNNDLLALGLDAAVEAGVVVAVAAGNSGPGPFTVESPGRARNVITVGASSNNHFVGQPISYGEGPTTIGAAVGDFPPLPDGTFDLFVSGDSGGLSNACAGLPNATTQNQVVLVTRGGCTFSTKVRSAIAAGYTGVIVRNNVAGDPSAMAKDGAGNDDLPAVMVGLDDGNALRSAAPATITVSATFSEFITDNGDILAGFSSQGPTFVDEAVKPDLTSVGVNVLSSVPCSFAKEGQPCGGDGTWAFFQGTSMATPHIAGSAAVLLDLHPDWTPVQVKSALVNTADLVVKNALNAATKVGPMAQGGGRENLTEAAEATVFFDPVSASFGKIDASRNSPTSMTIAVTNTSASSITFDLEALEFTPALGTLGAAFNGGSTSSGDDRISFPSTFTIGAGETKGLTITVKAGLPLGSIVQGWLTLAGPGEVEYHLAYWAHVAP
ncbi:MAG TPA: S8 family serine peptidase [Candidatus Binatia bacterium]|nr:S8 family serine peptidase [Candidatus Binatia bacterium]